MVNWVFFFLVDLSDASLSTKCRPESEIFLKTVVFLESMAVAFLSMSSALHLAILWTSLPSTRPMLSRVVSARV